MKVRVRRLEVLEVCVPTISVKEIKKYREHLNLLIYKKEKPFL